MEGAGVGLAAGVRAHVGLQTTGLVEDLAAAQPRASDVRVFVAVAALVRGKSVVAVVAFVAALVLADVGRVALVVGLHVKLERPLGLELLLAVWHVALDLVGSAVQLLMAPEIVDCRELTLTAGNFASIILSL